MKHIQKDHKFNHYHIFKAFSRKKDYSFIVKCFGQIEEFFKFLEFLEFSKFVIQIDSIKKDTMFMSTSLLETANPNASGKGNSGIKIYSLSTNEFSNNIL